MEYLTWRELRALLEKQLDNRVLDEPVLFSHLDAYGNETVVPVQLIQDTWHRDDTPSTVHYHPDDFEYSRFVPDEFTDEAEQPLRQLPPGALLLHYSDMEEDGDEQLRWLRQANPHTPTPAPPTPGPAPLFE